MKSILKKLTLFRRKLFFYVIWPLAFKFASKKGIDERLFVFAVNKNYTGLPDNLKEVYDYLSAKGYNCIVYNSPKSSAKRIFADIKFETYYARCKAVFLNDNFDPVNACKPNKGTKVIQLWHACGAFKKWGYSTLDLPWGGKREDMLRFPLYNNMTDVFVSAESVISSYSDAFRCSERIIKAYGTPRTDIYFDSDFVNSQREVLLKEYPEIGERKIILYAPTFRGNSPEQSYNDNTLDFGKLKNTLGKEYVLVFKLHPFTADKFKLTDEERAKFGDFVFNISDMKIETALCAADILIADYSSLIFEFALLNKPMLFYAYDLNEYEHDRSFYFDYKSFVPGRIVINNDEIISAVENESFRMNRISEFRERYMGACDGNSTKRIADYAII